MLFLSVIAVQVYRTMDKIMVGAISGMAQNGLYENAEKIVYCLSGFISAVGTVMLPKVAAMQARGETEAVRKHIALSMELIMCMTSAMAFGLAAVAREFAPLFFGEDFAESGTLMIPLGFTLIFIGFASVVQHAMGIAAGAGQDFRAKRHGWGRGEPHRQQRDDPPHGRHGRGGGHADGGVHRALRPMGHASPRTAL